MRAVKRWRVDIFIGEDDGRTYAEARLVTEIGDRLIGVGREPTCWTRRRATSRGSPAKMSTSPDSRPVRGSA